MSRGDSFWFQASSVKPSLPEAGRRERHPPLCRQDTWMAFAPNPENGDLFPGSRMCPENGDLFPGLRMCWEGDSGCAGAILDLADTTPRRAPLTWPDQAWREAPVQRTGARPPLPTGPGRDRSPAAPRSRYDAFYHGLLAARPCCTELRSLAARRMRRPREAWRWRS